MKKYKNLILLTVLILQISFNSFSDEVAEEGTLKMPTALNTGSKCTLKSNIYYIQDEGNYVILPLNEAKLRDDCEKKSNYSQIEVEYNKLSNTRCNVISESKRGGCKKTVGYINISYNNYSDIISGCKYYLKKEQFTKEIPENDPVLRESAPNCGQLSYHPHHRYVFRITDSNLYCSPKTPPKKQCITKNNGVLERVTEFRNGWKINNVIWSSNLGLAYTQKQANEMCKSIGGVLPSYKDIRTISDLTNITGIKDAWLSDVHHYYNHEGNARQEGMVIGERGEKKLGKDSNITSTALINNKLTTPIQLLLFLKKSHMYLLGSCLLYDFR